MTYKARSEFKILILLRVPHQSLAADGELATDLKPRAYPLLIQSQGPAHTLRKFVGICLNTNPCIQGTCFLPLQSLMLSPGDTVESNIHSMNIK